MRRRARPTIIDVARIAGVSTTTVSYVLSGPKQSAARISKETAARILEAVEEIGYIPNQTARTLRLQQTNRVLFLGSRLTSLYSQAMAISIEQALMPYGLSLSILIGSEADQTRRAITILDQNQADGLIAETGDAFLQDLRTAAERGHAIVAVGPSNPDPAFDVIMHNSDPAIRDVIQHVVDRTYCHFILLSMNSNVMTDSRVNTAFRHLLSLGIPETNIEVLHCPHDRITAYEIALEFLPRSPHPVAVYAGADISAIGVLWACLHLGLRVPDDVAIIGHGNTPEARITVPPMTSLGPVSNNFAQTADLIASRLKDRSLTGRHITECWRPYIRASTYTRRTPSNCRERRSAKSHDGTS